MLKQLATYGQAGGRGQGQPYSRFQIQGDPTPMIPLFAAGSMVSNSPAHLMGDSGGAYYYGTTKVGGITNMTLWRWTHNLEFPKPDFVLSRRKYWRHATVQTWLAAQAPTQQGDAA